MHLRFIFRPPNFDLQTNQAFIILHLKYFSYVREDEGIYVFCTVGIRTLSFPVLRFLFELFPGVPFVADFGEDSSISFIIPKKKHYL